MKKLKLLLVLFTLIACESKDIIEDCGCEKITYYYKDNSTQYLEIIETYIISVEDVECMKSEFKKTTTDQNIFYSIKCKN